MTFLRGKHILLTSILSIFMLSFIVEKDPQDIFTKTYEQAVENVIDSNYKSANISFIQLIKADIILPDEFAFYFGKSLYNTTHYTQSKALLEKYLTLINKSGSFYDETITILTDLDERLAIKEKKETKETAEKIQHHNEETTCDGHEHYTCPICDGSKVRLEKTSFGQVFSTCDYCDKHGQMNCKDYARYLNGTIFDK